MISLIIDEVAAHIQQGKRPTQLALTWGGRVSFVLTDALALKRIRLLDVAIEGAGSGGDQSGFDADVALVTGELGRLLPNLIDALGGERADNIGASQGTPSAGAPTPPAA